MPQGFSNGLLPGTYPEHVSCALLQRVKDRFEHGGDDSERATVEMLFASDAACFKGALASGPAWTVSTGPAATSQQFKSPFWASSTWTLYSLPQVDPNALATPAVVKSKSCLGVSSPFACLNGSPSVGWRPQHMQLPCPTLYQAKEPEAIADVFKRAGKKALGGGIPVSTHF